MRFGEVLDTVGGFLRQVEAPYAVIGGIALATLGIQRTTYDLDLIVPRRVQAALIADLERQGYRTLHRSNGFSNHLHTESRKGRLDVVYIDESTSTKLFAEVRILEGPEGREIPVPCAEHLAAMKVLAIKNEPSRTFQDLADIRELLLLPGVDREAIRESFARHGLLERYDDLEKFL